LSYQSWININFAVAGAALSPSRLNEAITEQRPQYEDEITPPN